MIKIVHVITGLSTGGAEMMLFKLLSCTDRSAFDVSVVSLTAPGPLAAKIEALGIGVTTLGMHRGVPDPRTLARLVKLFRQQSPDLVQTWMYHSDLLGGVAARLAGIPVLWNIRHSNLDAGVNKKMTILTARLCAVLSRFVPHRIICNSETARKVHARLGYRDQLFEVIPNGFDANTFFPDPAASREVRRELGIADGGLLIGLVARFDPQKDHFTFISAAGRLADAGIKAHFLLCGDGVDRTNAKLMQWIADAGHCERFILLGRRQDVPRLTAALDVAVSSSCGEGFSNAIGEAMACGVPCVVTDVGDSAAVVADTGCVVPHADPAALAAALQRMACNSVSARKELGGRARERVLELYALPAVVQRYEKLYLEMC